MHWIEMDSPVGRIDLAADGEGLRALCPGGGGLPASTQAPQAVRSLLLTAAARLEAYFTVGRASFDLPLRPRGTPFQQRAWRVLCSIPCGRTISYAEQARRLGAQGASRAVGSANGRNPLPILIPCHRVVRTDGALGGYRSGTALKRWLLAHERAGLEGRA